MKVEFKVELHERKQRWHVGDEFSMSEFCNLAGDLKVIGVESVLVQETIHRERGSSIRVNSVDSWVYYVEGDMLEQVL